MSYAVRIEREDVLDPITKEEWTAYVDADPEMTFPPDVLTLRGEVHSYRAAGSAVWAGHPSFDVDKYPRSFSYRDGRVCVEDPDGDTVEKMVGIAERLRAQVVGDDGEIYQ